MRGWFWASLLLFGCQPGDIVLVGDSGGSVLDDTGADSGDDSGGDSGDDSGGDDSDAPLDSGGDSPDGRLTDASWRLHEQIESLVYVTWTQSTAGTTWVEWSLDGEETRSSPPIARDAGTHEQLVLGIPYGERFTWRVVMDDGGDRAETLDAEGLTGLVPDDLPVPELLTGDEAAWEPSGVYLLGSINRRSNGWNEGQYWKFILDRQGRVVWAVDTPDNHWTIYMQPSADGRAILWDEATYWSDFEGGDDSVVHRWKIDGTEEAVYATPGLHHSFTQLPDGSLVWGAAYGSESNPSESLEQLAPDGQQSTIWDCQDFFDEIGASSRERCQSNSIWYDVGSDTFLFSFYTTNSIVEIDHATGASLRYFGALGGAWGFDPSDSQFWWQHGPSWTDEGHLLVSSERNDEETVVYEYELDPARETLVEVWSFGKGEGIHGTTNGEAHRLANGNTLHNMGAASRFREVTPGGDVVWDLDFGYGRLLGRSIWVEDLYAFAP